jgi:AraC-like DNA-binding protein
MDQLSSQETPPSEGLDGDIATILMRFLDDASRSIGRDTVAAHAHIDRASALLEGERCRLAHRFSESHLGNNNRVLAPWQLKRVTAYVTVNIDTPIQLSKLASLTGLTVQEFSAAFDQSFGMSVREYIDLRRMNLACILMLTTDRPLFQIAPTCGFLDQEEFCSLFLNIFGQEPGEWRWQRRGFFARL